MFEYSFSTVFMAITMSNLLIVFVSMCFRRKKILLTFGYQLLILIIFLILIRFLLPFGVPPITTDIHFPKFISLIVSYLLHPFFTIWGFGISAWKIFECVWALGFIYHLQKPLKEYFGLERYLAIASIDVTQKEPYSSIVKEICDGRRDRFRILQVQNLFIPQSYGVFKPRILLPMSDELTEEDLYYSLRHEISHHRHHDIFIKRIVMFLSVVYWWNPACSSLKKQVTQLLEMRVDGALVKGEDKITNAYLRSLIHVFECAENTKTNDSIPPAFTMSMADVKSRELLIERFDMMCRKKTAQNTLLSVLLFLLVISMYLASYLFAFENYYAIEKNVDGTYNMSDNDFIAVPKDDGTYDIYLNGIFIENMDSLEYYPVDVLIDK